MFVKPSVKYTRTFDTFCSCFLLVLKRRFHQTGMMTTPLFCKSASDMGAPTVGLRIDWLPAPVPNVPPPNCMPATELIIGATKL